MTDTVQTEQNDQTLEPGEETLSQDIRNIIGGVATIVIIVVPILLIRKLVKTVEQSKGFQSIENALM